MEQFSRAETATTTESRANGIRSKIESIYECYAYDAAKNGDKAGFQPHHANAAPAPCHFQSFQIGLGSGQVCWSIINFLLVYNQSIRIYINCSAMLFGMVETWTRYSATAAANHFSLRNTQKKCISLFDFFVAFFFSNRTKSILISFLFQFSPGLQRRNIIPTRVSIRVRDPSSNRRCIWNWIKCAMNAVHVAIFLSHTATGHGPGHFQID